MLEMFNNPSIGLPIMLGAIAAMNYYIRKNQMVRIRQYYDQMVKKQEQKTQKLTYELLADIYLT